MSLVNLQATITLEVNKFEDVDIATALKSLEQDLRERLNVPMYTNVVVTTQKKSE